jgi:predicted Zn-dependent protease
MRWLPYLLISAAAIGQSADVYSQQKEQALGKSLATDFERRYQMSDDPVVGQYVQKLADNLAAAAGLNLPVQAKVVESADPIAAALPGGFLFLSSGMISHARTEAELAGILAHEIAHIASGRRMHQTTSGKVVVFTGARSGLCERFSDGVTPRKVQDAQRGFEQEADLSGVEYAANAGFDPHGLVDFFERPHPGAPELAAVRAKADELTAAHRNLATNSPEFQSVKERLPERRVTPPSLRRPNN